MGETQFALGLYRYRCLGDYEGALAAFQKAREQAANRVQAAEFSAYVKRRQGKWDDALKLHSESLELDPRNPILLSEAALTDRAMRRFKEAAHLVDRALEIEPNNPALLVERAEIELAQGNVEGATRLIERAPSDPRQPDLFLARIRYWVCTRQYPKAMLALRNAIAAPEQVPALLVPSFHAWLGIAEALAGLADAAKLDLGRARDGLATIRAQGHTSAWIVRDSILTAGFLNDKEALEREAAQVQERIQTDAVDGPSLEVALAMARAQLGETDAVIASLQHLLQTYGEFSLTPALLRLDPIWDPIRNDPRFQKLGNGGK